MELGALSSRKAMKIKKLKPTGEGKLTWTQAYVHGVGLVLLALGSVWLYRFGSQLYDIIVLDGTKREM